MIYEIVPSSMPKTEGYQRTSDRNECAGEMCFWHLMSGCCPYVSPLAGMLHH